LGVVQPILLIFFFSIFWDLASQTTPHAWGGLGVAPAWPEGIYLTDQKGFLLVNEVQWTHRAELIPSFLLVNEVQRPHQTGGIPSGQWGAKTSSNRGNSFCSMRRKDLIKQRELLLFNEAQRPHKTEGIPSAQWGSCTSSKKTSLTRGNFSFPMRFLYLIVVGYCTNTSFGSFFQCLV
jgi:hypothetical protein